MVFLRLCNKVRVPEPLAFHIWSDTLHVVNSAKRVLVVTARKLGNVTVRMPTRHIVVRSVIAPLHHRPKALHAVRVRLFPDVLRDAMLHRFLVLEAHICHGTVGIHLHAFLGIIIQKALTRSCVRTVHNSLPR